MSDVFDCIVVGAGGAGLAAAYAAASRGASVIVLERRPQPGGTTGIAVGSFTAAETRWQQQAGVSDSAADHAEDLALFAKPDIEARNNEPLRRFFLQQAGTTLAWLEQELGLSYVGPSPEPPNRQPRMHNVVPGAKAYITRFQLALRRLGVPLVSDAEVSELKLRDCRVEGVVVRQGQTTRTLTARNGVILATGDYANNGEMIAEHKGPQFQQIEGINPHALGLGHQLASQAGAQLVNMDVTYGPELRLIAGHKRPFQQWLPTRGVLATLMGWLAGRMPRWMLNRFIKRLLVTWQHPEESLFRDGAILINSDGERFVNELCWPEREIAVARQPGKVAYLLLDGRLAELYSAWPKFISTAPDIAYAYVKDYLKLRPDVTVQADSLESLMARRGIDLTTVQATLRSFNRHLVGSEQDPFEHPGGTAPLEKGPWLLLGPVKAYFTTTEGGAAVNEQLQVLDPEGQPIAGLYAAGQVGLGGMILWSHGLHIAWAMTSGKLAGESVAGV